MKVLFSAVEKDKVLCNHQTCSLLVKNSWITVFLGKSTCILGFEVDQREWVDQSRYIKKKKWFSGDLCSQELDHFFMLTRRLNSKHYKLKQTLYREGTRMRSAASCSVVLPSVLTSINMLLCTSTLTLFQLLLNPNFFSNHDTRPDSYFDQRQS